MTSWGHARVGFTDALLARLLRSRAYTYTDKAEKVLLGSAPRGRSCSHRVPEICAEMLYKTLFLCASASAYVLTPRAPTRVAAPAQQQLAVTMEAKQVPCH